MDSAEVTGLLSTTVDIPKTERQARELVPLMRLYPEKAAEVFQELRAEIKFGHRRVKVSSIREILLPVILV